MQTRKIYRYAGPVFSLGRPVASRWVGTTMAASPQKAKSNLPYQVKRELGLVPSASIVLTGRVTEAAE